VKHSIISFPFFLLLGTTDAINPLVIYFCILFPFVTVERIFTHIVRFEVLVAVHAKIRYYTV